MIPEDHDAAVRTRVAELYALYSEDLLGFIRSMLPISKADANDVLHHIFDQLLGWAAKNRDVTIEQPRAFVYQVARRHVIKYIHKLHRTPSNTADALPLESLDFGTTAQEDDVEYLASVDESRRNILRAMRRLGDAHPVDELQVITYFKFWVGMTETEIGAVLGHKRATIAGRLRKAKAGLLIELQKLERREPGTTRTSTTLLHRWWRQLEKEAGELASTGPEAEDEGNNDSDS